MRWNRVLFVGFWAFAAGLAQEAFPEGIPVPVASESAVLEASSSSVIPEVSPTFLAPETAPESSAQAPLVSAPVLATSESSSSVALEVVAPESSGSAVPEVSPVSVASEATPVSLAPEGAPQPHSSSRGFFVSVFSEISMTAYSMDFTSPYYVDDGVDAFEIVFRPDVQLMAVVGYEAKWRVALALGGIFAADFRHEGMDYLSRMLMPAAHLDVGLGFVGFRETLSIHLNGGDVLAWISKTGVTLRSGSVGIEGGYTLIDNFGCGPYLGVFFEY